LTSARPLRFFRLLEVEAGANLTTAPLRIDERILHYVAGINLLDPRLESLLHISPSPSWIAEKHRKIALQLEKAIESYSQHSLIVHLCGDDPQGQEDAAALAAQNTSRQLLVLQAEDVPAVGPDLDRLALLWQRESLLLPGTLLVQCGAAGLTPSARYLVERLPGLLFLASREPVRLNRTLIRFDVDKPGPVEQKHLWQRALGAAAENLNVTLDDLSEQFRLSAKMIFSTGSLFVPESVPFSADGLWNACRSLARPKLENLAQRIVPSATWADLVLPELQEQILRQLAAQVRHRMKVYENWGFSA